MERKQGRRKRDHTIHAYNCLGLHSNKTAGRAQKIIRCACYRKPVNDLLIGSGDPVITNDGIYVKPVNRIIYRRYTSAGAMPKRIVPRAHPGDPAVGTFLKKILRIVIYVRRDREPHG